MGLDANSCLVFVLLKFETVRCSFCCLMGSRMRVISLQPPFLSSSGVTWSSFLLGGTTEDLADMIRLQTFMNYILSDFSRRGRVAQVTHAG